MVGVPRGEFFTTEGLWDFAWWMYRDVNFSPRITQIALIFYFFRVNSRLIWARPCEIPKSHHGLVGTACPHYAQLALIFLFFRVNSRYLS